MDERQQLRSKRLDQPDEQRTIGRGTGTFVELAGVLIGRAVLEPGWRWSEDVKPLVGTPSCEVHHIHLLFAGRFAVRMESGEEHEFGPNDVIEVPPGHDAWVVGDEPVVLLDLSGNAADFALPAPRARTVVTMLLTDIVDSTRIASRVGDAAWKQRLAEHDRIVRLQLGRFNGREVETTGDGFLTVFGSARAALLAALAIRDGVESAGVTVRAGVHTGEVEVLADGGIQGLEVHAAARIAAEATARTVLSSAVTRALAPDPGLRFESAGLHELKGFDEPFELFRVESAADQARARS